MNAMWTMEKNRKERRVIHSTVSSMNLYHLYCFQVVAQESHITRAAQKLNIAQPALSATIAKLEKQLDMPLFDRVGRQVVLNDCGKMFLEDVNIILEQWETANNKLEKYKRDHQQQICLATTGILFPQHLVRDFKLQYPLVTIKQSNIMVDDIESSLLSRKSDFVISSLKVQNEDIGCHLLKKEPLWLLVNKEDPLASKKSVSITDLDGRNFISLPEGYAYRKAIDDWFASEGLIHHVVFECFSPQFPDLVKQKIGLAFATDATVKSNFYPPEVVTVPIVPSFERNLYILWEKSTPFSPISKTFYQYVINYKDL